MTDIQSTLDEYARQTDKRTSVFDIAVQELRNSSLTLCGRLLDSAQLDDLVHLFPSLHLDTTSVRILSREPRGAMHASTNLTGLYERPTFGMPLSSELCYGTEVEVLEESKDWVFTKQPDGYLGWAYRPYLKEGPAPKPTHMVLAPAVELRAGPEPSSEILTRLVSGTGVVLEESRGAWSFVSANRSGWLPSASLRALTEIPDSIEEKRQAIAADSQRMIGIPYLWGGTSGNGIDCSGFARLLHRWVGIQIPRDADMQHAAAGPVEPPFEVGDLFFFAEKDSSRKITHVGVSLGGWKMIHSSRGNNGVYINDLQQSQSLMDIFVSAGSFLR
jgi:cell wall-associated NlpC family hydrolase